MHNVCNKVVFPKISFLEEEKEERERGKGERKGKKQENNLLHHHLTPSELKNFPASNPP